MDPSFQMSHSHMYLLLVLLVVVTQHGTFQEKRLRELPIYTVMLVSSEYYALEYMCDPGSVCEVCDII